jgi:signal transduction histidine kinase
MLRRLKIALIAAVVIPTLLLAAGAWDERTQLLHAAEGDARATVIALREHAIKAIETDELLIRELDTRVHGMTREAIGASPTLPEEIAAMHAGMPEVAAMAVVDVDGNCLVGDGPNRRTGIAPLANREAWYTQRGADRGTFIGRAYAGSPSGRQEFGVSRRRRTPDGSFDGVVQIAVASAYFSDFWSQVIGGRNDVAIGLLRSDGEVLAHLPAVGDSWKRAMQEADPFIRDATPDPQGDVARATSTTDGVERIYVYSKVGPYPLVIGYSVTVPSVIAPWRQHLLDFVGVGVLATAALLLAVLATIQQVHRLMAEQARRIAVEQAAQKGQRLELLGQLTAGIGHDFANILQAIGVAATLLKRGAGHPERVRSLADRLAEDVERGSSLTRRMLDLVRQNSGRVEGRPGTATALINPAEAIKRVCEMLPRLLGGGYRLRCEVADDLPAFMQGDRSELELAVMNLAVNARDAMPIGGEIIVRTASETVGGALHNGADDPPTGLAPGAYVRISVVDKGVGMSPEVLAQAAELFFTTKPQGRGTGLGLARARGFAERSGGMLSIESKEGRGTTVTLWLPAAAPFLAVGPKAPERVR